MVDELAKTRGHEMRVIGIPKTVDNDLDLTDHCPGYGSVIKYLATMTMETGLDTEASYTSDPVNVIEAIGRDAGWIAGGAALAKRDENDAPHVILLPEIPFAADRVAERLESCLTKIGRAVIVVSEGLKTADGQYVSRRTGQFSSDTFGHPQLGGASDFVRDFVEGTLHVKCRTCRPSIILRNGMHCASLSDCREALHVGERAVQLAVSGVSGKMVTLERLSENPYRCGVGAVDLALVANRIKPVPRDWISADGLSVEDRFIRYAMPLIQGEVRPAMRDGLPDFVRLRRTWVSP
jgi:6-phosphofructokinase 1